MKLWNCRFSVITGGRDAIDKFAGLACVMPGRYDWKPGEGVRCVGDVFNLIVSRGFG